MSYLARQSNGITPNGRAEKSGYLDSSQVPQKQKQNYQGSPDAGPFAQSVSGGPKFSSHNPNVRSQYSNSYHTNANMSPQSNNHAWDREPPPPFNQQHGHNRYNMNSHLANGNFNGQSQQSPNPSTNHHSQPRRQTQPPRPQVRLPASSIPNRKTQESQPVNRESDSLKSRQPPQSAQVKSSPGTTRRHRHSTSSSSKASTGSTGLSSTVNTSTHSSLSTTLPLEQSSPLSPPPSSDTPTESPDNNSEWLLLRKETFERPPPSPRDEYAHLHPLVRKYASITYPEVKMGEPRIANAVMSRRWQREETLERDKREAQRRREEGIPEEKRSTCFTEQQDRANRLAMLTLEILRTEFRGHDEGTASTGEEKNEEQKDNDTRDE